jgi:hypothetical protein
MNRARHHRRAGAAPDERRRQAPRSVGDRSDRASGGVDWRSRIEDICQRHGAHLAQDFDVSPYLYVADSLVTDHSSVGFEFMLLNRPLVVDQPALIASAGSARKARCCAAPPKWCRLPLSPTPSSAASTAVPVQRAPTGHRLAALLPARQRQRRAVQCVYSLLELSLPEAAPA